MDQTSMKDVAKNMRRTGMFLFRDAFLEALRSTTPFCVMHAAHAAEILLKARIAQEHPLLIFSKLPKANSTQDFLTLIDLLERGRTFSYEELPDQLWATTGIKIEQINQYKEFGRLRNQMVHLSMANSEQLDVLTVHYSLEVLDPLIESFWGRSVIEFITKDPHPDYASFVSTGLFEDYIRFFFTIDKRLRRLLGDVSKKGWEDWQAHEEQKRKLDESQTQEDKEAIFARYEDLLAKTGENPEYEEQVKQQEQDEADWEAFLNSF